MDLGWEDSTGFANNADVANPGFSPQSFLNVLNGYAAMRRVNEQGLKFTSLLSDSGGTFSTYLVVNLGSLITDDTVIMDTTNSQWSVFNLGRTGVGGAVSEGGLSIAVNTWTIVSLECSGPGGTYVLRANGNVVLTGTASNGFFNELWLTLNPSDQGTSSGVLLQAEFASFFAVLPPEERYKVEGYLVWKFELENSLPFDHPYRFTPPRV